MTEKDAVKCGGFADARLWSLPVSAVLSATAESRVRELCENLRTT
jgi:tetraacyldisaccharide-1-P 4'-kinase